jgi:hypothetical protein
VTRLILSLCLRRSVTMSLKAFSQLLLDFFRQSVLTRLRHAFVGNHHSHMCGFGA